MSKFTEQFRASRDRIAAAPLPTNDNTGVPARDANAFPTGLLPSAMREAINAVCGLHGCPAELAAQAALAIASHAVQGHYNAESELFGEVPLSEFFFVIARSGAAKSTIWRELNRGYHRWLSSAIEHHQTVEREYAVHKESHEISIVAAKREKDPAERTRELLKLENTRPPFTPEPNATVEKTTTVGLYRKIGRAIPSLAIMTDEGGQLLGSHAFRSDGGTNALEFVANMTKLWDGSAIDRNNGEVSEFYPKRRLTSLIMVQEAVAREFLSSKMFAEQGIHARMLIADVPSYQRPPIDITTAAGTLRRDALAGKVEPFNDRIEKLHRTFEYQTDGRDFWCEPMTLRMTRDAKAHLQAWHHANASLAVTSDLAFHQRLYEHALRLGGICAAFDAGRNIEARHIEAGTALVDYYSGQWLALDTSTAPERSSDEMAIVTKLAAWLKLKGPQTKRDLDRAGPRAFRDCDLAMKRRVLLAGSDALMFAESNVTSAANGATSSIWSAL